MCSFCGVARRDARWFVSSGVDDALYICDSCTRLARSVDRDGREASNDHGRLREVSCDFCGLAASRAGRMVTGQGRTICDGCVAYVQGLADAQEAQD